MQTHSHAHEHHAACCDHEVAPRLFLWICIGTAFVVNAYLADWLYKLNAPVGDVSAAIGAIILMLPILRTALRDLRRGEVRMNELVAIAVLAAFVQGDFRTAGVVAFFMLISVVIETRSAEGAHAAIESLIRLTPTTACRLTKTGEEIIPADQLHAGDRVRILPGDNVPADGQIQTAAESLAIDAELLDQFTVNIKNPDLAGRLRSRRR